MEALRSFSVGVRNTNSDERFSEFIISTNAEDRHGTILGVDRWELDNYNANGIVGYNHEVYGGDLFSASDPDSIIGKGSAYVEKKRGKEAVLVGRVDYEPADMNPKAEKIFRKVTFGTLKSSSVGFLPLGLSDERKPGIPTYKSQELLEWSIVNIPSNPEALKRMLDEVESKRTVDYIKRVLQLNQLDLKTITVEEAIEVLERKKQFTGMDTRKEEEEATEDEASEETVEEETAEEQKPTPSGRKIADLQTKLAKLSK